MFPAWTTTNNTTRRPNSTPRTPRTSDNRFYTHTPARPHAGVDPMPDRLDIAGLRLCVPAEPLTAAAFAPFGDVIENPRPDVLPSTFAAAAATAAAAVAGGPGAAPAAAATAAPAGFPFNPVSANQGSAIKYQRVSALADRYTPAGAPSGVPSAPLASLFVCAARRLQRDDTDPDRSPDRSPDPVHGSVHGLDGGVFPVSILERHPYTTQTFVPLVARPAAPPTTAVAPTVRYLVIVAPTTTDAAATTVEDRVRRPPDLRGLRAFVARGDQAVTYGVATWHAPMAALGPPGTAQPFFVFQFANGVGPEDCEEVVLDSGSGGAGVSVCVPPSVATPKARLWTKL